MQLWHLFTALATVLGVGNTAFLIFDRLFRYRPVASVSAARGWSGGGDATPYLRVKNMAPFDIVVERFSVYPPHLVISANSEIRAMVDALVRSDVPIILGPEEERRLVLVIRDRANRSERQPIDIVIEWRRGRSTWLRQMPVTVRTSIEDIELRERAALNNARD
jgi:hypothetical protein